jgi:hypothetical protein
MGAPEWRGRGGTPRPLASSRLSIEDGTYVWFRGLPYGDDEFDGDNEWWATIPPNVINAFSGHFPYDPSMDSMKQYPTRAEAIAVLLRATDPVEMFVPEPVTVETT